MAITHETAKYVAELSRLKIADDELDRVCGKLNDIINHMDEINSSVDTTGTELKASTMVNVMRPDEVVPSGEREILLSNAPERTEETPIVPKTVD